MLLGNTLLGGPRGGTGLMVIATRGRAAGRVLQHVLREEPARAVLGEMPAAVEGASAAEAQAQAAALRCLCLSQAAALAAGLGRVRIGLVEASADPARGLGAPLVARGMATCISECQRGRRGQAIRRRRGARGTPTLIACATVPAAPP